MRKKILLTVLAVSLLLGGLSGAVYAVGEHEPMHGEKLVGIGQLGTQVIGSTGEVRVLTSSFAFTNPDDLEYITIKRVSVISSDETLIYEGPLLNVTPGRTWTREIVTSLSPHEIRNITLGFYMWTGDVSDNLTAPDNSNRAPTTAITAILALLLTLIFPNPRILLKLLNQVM